jgi:WD40 repeat protein
MARSDELGHSHGFIRRLGSFLRSAAFLAWIEAIAVAGHLQILASTSKALSSYLERTKKINADENPLSQPLEDMDLLGVWSTELVRLAGKFGTHLIQHPRAIYALIPVFCPPNSAISQHFGAKGPLAPRVTGLSNSNWDDSLANFSLGNNKRPKAIHCMDSAFAILTFDRVTTYDAATFQETQKYTHDEAVVVSSFNDDGDLLVTGGIKTIKVWNVATGQLLYTYSNPNRMRAMALAFSRDSSEVLVFCVDSGLRRQLLSEPEDWVHIPWKARNEPTNALGGGAPIAAAFSVDGSKLVMSHRTAPISVWDTDSGNLIGRMERRAGRQFARSSNLDYAVRLVWNPVTEHIVGAWSTGKIFKWYPLDPEHEEMENPSVKASEITCSPDGRLIVVGQMDGSLKVLGFDTFTLLYSLSCMTRASAVAVSPDGRRIYDLRQSFCNVWEPNALIRMAEQDDRFSDAASSHYDASVTTSMISEASAPVLEAVTAVCYDPTSTAYAFGNDGGIVKYFSPDSYNSADMQFGTMSITCLVFSQDGQFIASTNMDGSIFVRKISSDCQLEATPVLQVYSESLVAQILFDWSGEHIMVRCDESVKIWSLQAKSQICTHPTRAKASCLLPQIAHPGFISIDMEALTYQGVDGSSFSRELNIDLDLLAKPDTYNTEKTIGKISQYANFDDLSFGRTIKTPNSSDILITIVKSTRNGARIETLAAFLKASTLVAPANDTDSPTPLDPTPKRLTPLPNTIQSMMEVPLGFIGAVPHGWSGETHGAALRPSARLDNGCLLAFIDRDFWVRTWSVDDTDGVYSKQHFFLPRDWVKIDSLKLASVTPDGRLLCPRGGEVAVVHNGFTAEWVA